MAETIKSPDGEVLRMIARAKTTQNSNNSVKPLDTDSTTIEVLFFDGRVISQGSQWGHVAIDIDGTIYTRAHPSYFALSGKERTKYLADNHSFRDYEGLVLRVSPDEKQKIVSELKRRVSVSSPYSLLDNSCSTNVADVLEMIGILSHDPRYFSFDSDIGVSPKEELIVLSRSKRIVKRNQYPKQKK